MSGCVEHGKCDICGKEDFLQRTYFRYNIKCECHSPYHFELKIHCKNCTPKEPFLTRITLKTDYIKKLSNAINITERKEKLNKINNL